MDSLPRGVAEHENSLKVDFVGLAARQFANQALWLYSRDMGVLSDCVQLLVDRVHDSSCDASQIYGLVRQVRTATMDIVSPAFLDTPSKAQEVAYDFRMLFSTTRREQ
jgi:hypothetical protein